MSKDRAYLVVGGDSLVGGSLVSALRKRGHLVYETTRRVNTLDNYRLFLDFENEIDFKLPEKIDYVYVVAAATNYDRCEKDPMAHKINVELIPRLIEKFLKRDIFVTFISTNSVFGGERPWPNEDDPHDPRIHYAKQKNLAEIAVQNFAKKNDVEHNLNIVRLTKILDSDTAPIPAWTSSWKKEEIVTPFMDLIFAPMSIQFVGNSLAVIGEKRISGNFHLSGYENINYVEFAKLIAKKMGVAQRLICSSTATACGIHIAFKPTYSGLGMLRTTQLTGIEPQKIDSVITDIFQ